MSTWDRQVKFAMVFKYTMLCSPMGSWRWEGGEDADIEMEHVACLCGIFGSLSYLCEWQLSQIGPFCNWG